MRVLNMDSLRPEHLGCYGYPRPTSTNADHNADGGIRFESTHAAYTPSLPWRSAVFGARDGSIAA